jgi:hypothetical protein
LLSIEVILMNKRTLKMTAVAAALPYEAHIVVVITDVITFGLLILS